MSWAEHDDERVEYAAFPHEEGGGFSYNIRLSALPNDVIHLDTARGTVFDDEEIVAMAVFWRLMRAKRGT